MLFNENVKIFVDREVNHKFVWVFDWVTFSVVKIIHDVDFILQTPSAYVEFSQFNKSVYELYILNWLCLVRSRSMWEEAKNKQKEKA